MTPRQRLGLLLAGASVVLAACTSSGGDQKADDPVINPGSSAAAPSTSVAAPSLSTPVSTPPTSTAPTTSAVPSTTTASAPPTSANRPPVVARSTCRQVGIRVIPGGATFGEEIAGLQFTNEGTKACRLVGYATVTLLLHGRPVGRPSLPATPADSARTLAPGEVAESLLHDRIRNCQAPLSDTIRVVAPGTTISASRPMQLRACVLHVDRLGAPD